MQELREKFSKKFSSKTKRRSWQRAAEIVEKHSEAMVERWVTEIDALPTFVSATLSIEPTPFLTYLPRRVSLPLL